MGCLQIAPYSETYWYLAYPVIANIVDILFQVHYKHQNSLVKYLTADFAKVDVLVNFGLLGLLVAAAWQSKKGADGAANQDAIKPVGTGAELDWVRVMASALAGEAACCMSCVARLLPWLLSICPPQGGPVRQ